MFFVILKSSWTEKILKMCASLWTLETIELPSCLGNISNPSVWSIVLKNLTLKGYSAITLHPTPSKDTIAPYEKHTKQRDSSQGWIQTGPKTTIWQTETESKKVQKQRGRLKGLIWDWSKEWLPKSPHGTAATSYSCRGLLPWPLAQTSASPTRPRGGAFMCKVGTLPDSYTGSSSRESAPLIRCHRLQCAWEERLHRRIEDGRSDKC